MADRTGAGRITTHVLDTARGYPAAGLRLELVSRRDDGAEIVLRSATTNADGRCDAPLLEGAEFGTGRYEIRFHVGDYLQANGGGERPFYETIPVPFVVSDAALHYHVPLLLAPFGYATYRGS